MRRLVIDRAKWRCGGFPYDIQAGDTMLLNDKGFMCCIGFEALALGLAEEAIKNHRGVLSCPASVAPLLVAAGLVDDDHNERDTTYWTDTAYGINDDERISAHDRESRLIAHFAIRDVELVFEGEYPDFMQAGSATTEDAPTTA